MYNRLGRSVYQLSKEVGARSMATARMNLELDNPAALSFPKVQ